MLQTGEEDSFQTVNEDCCQTLENDSFQTGSGRRTVLKLGRLTAFKLPSCPSSPKLLHDRGGVGCYTCNIDTVPK